MKRIIGLILAMMLCISLLSVTANAADASATLTGPTTVRSGNSITLTFSVNGKDISGLQGKLVYDPEQVTLVSTKQVVESPWMVEFNDNTFIAYDNNLSDPINKSTNIFTVTFKVKQLSVGTKINISCSELVASEISSGENLADVTYSATISAALSTNNKLQDLKVSNATISPAFDPNVTEYTAEVPFSVSKLVISAVQADKADMKINNPTLTPGAETDVTITVTAESGAKRVYTIKVKRAQDPNYEAGSNNFLSGIQVEGFMLSPSFDKNVYEYVLWLPYEVEKLTVTGSPEDSKASVRVEGAESLIAGEDNEVKVICTAENGKEKVYTIIAKRASGHGGDVPPVTTTPVNPPIPTDPITQPTEPDLTDPTTKPGTMPSTSKPSQSGGNDSQTSILLIILYVIIAVIALFAILVLVMFILGMRRKGRYAKKKARNKKK